MKFLLKLTAFLLISSVAIGQVTPPAAVQARRISATDVITLRDKRVDSISHDTALTANSNWVLASQAAIKEYVEKRKNYNRPVYGFGSVTQTNDSTLQLINDVVSPGNNKYYGTNGSGVKGYYTLPAGAGSGNVVPMTMAELDASSGLATDVYIFITDAYRQGYFVYSGTVANQTTDNAGTIVVNTGLQQFTRVVADGDAVLAPWFGAIPDYTYSGTGIMGTGTDATPAVQAALTFAASRRQHVLLPAWGTGYYFDGSLSTWFNSSNSRYLEFDGFTYHNPNNPNPFLIIQGTGGSIKNHKFIHNGRAIGREGIATHNNLTSGPDYQNYTSVFIRFYQSFGAEVTVGWVQGFGEAFRFDADTDGTQKNKVTFNRLQDNRLAIGFHSLDGSTYIDKNDFYGGWISGDTAILIDGYTTGSGAARSNSWNNILFERLNYGIMFMSGDNTYNKFIGGGIEGGTTTGIFGTKIYLNSTGGTNKIAFCTSFTGFGIINPKWFADRGVQTTFTGTHVFLDAPSFQMIGTQVLGGKNGRMTIIGNDTLTNNSKTLLRDSFPWIDHIAYVNVKNEKTMFAVSTINGVQNYVYYEGKVRTIGDTSAATTTLPVPTKAIRVNRTTAVTLLLDAQEVLDGKEIIIDQQGTGTIELRRASDNALLMPTTRITSTGRWRVEYVTAQATFIGDKLGGTGGGGGGSVTALPVGTAPNAQGATTPGDGTITLQPADRTNPGVVVTTAQDFGPGEKMMDSAEVKVFNVQGTAGIKNEIVGRANGFSVNDNLTANSAGASTFTNYNWGSGSSSKDIYFSFGKTSVTSVGFGNNGTNLVAATEKATNGFEWRKGIGFSSASFSAGTKLMELVAAGNLILQNGGTYTDNGNRLQVTGRASVTDQFYLGQLAADPATNLVNGAMYYNTTSNKFRGYENGIWLDMIGGGTGGGGGITAFATPVTATGANGGDVVSGNPRLFFATSTQPGIISTGNQTLPGIKTFASTVNFRASTTGAGTTSFKLAAGEIPTIPENGGVFFNGTYFYGGANNSWQSFTTNSNVQTLTNKFWDGSRIPENKGGTPDPTNVTGVMKAYNNQWYVEEENGELGYHRIYHVTTTASNTQYSVLFYDLDIPDNSSGIYEIKATARTTGGTTWERVFYVTFDSDGGTSGDLGTPVDTYPETFDTGADNWDMLVEWIGGGFRTQVRGYATAQVYWKVVVDRIVNVGSTPLIKP